MGKRGLSRDYFGTEKNSCRHQAGIKEGPRKVVSQAAGAVFKLVRQCKVFEDRFDPDERVLQHRAIKGAGKDPVDCRRMSLIGRALRRGPPGIWHTGRPLHRNFPGYPRVSRFRPEALLS